MDSIGEKIRIQRTIKRYSQEYMAFMLDISQAAYSKIERSETDISIRRIYAIAEILEISPFKLMPPTKYDSSINLHGVYGFYYKAKMFYRRRLFQNGRMDVSYENSQSDISNTETC